MSKAEEEANKRYRITRGDDTEETSGIDMQRALDFIEGYHQAEKDLTDKAKVSSGWDGFFYGRGYKQAEENNELTWEDMRIILDAENDIIRECNSQKELVIETYPKGEDYYGEILKRFKERKEKSC